jgi:hypothetical protein
VIFRTKRQQHIDALMKDARAWQHRAEESERRFEEFLRWDERRQPMNKRTLAGALRDLEVGGLGWPTPVTRHTPSPRWSLAAEQAKQYIHLAARFSDLTDVYGPIKDKLPQKG